MKLLYMLENSKTLNTIIKFLKNFIICKKVKDITMSNQQVAKNNFHIFLNIMQIYVFGNLRDYTRRINSRGWLRDSPIFFKNVNKLLIKKFSHLEPKLDPNWVTGFVDSEGCFTVAIEILDPLKWKVRISFEISLHEKDKEILEKIKSFFGVGAIYNRSDKKICVYRITNINYINDIIIPHFIKYPLISKKKQIFYYDVKLLNLF